MASLTIQLVWHIHLNSICLEEPDREVLLGHRSADGRARGRSTGSSRGLRGRARLESGAARVDERGLAVRRLHDVLAEREDALGLGAEALVLPVVAQEADLLHHRVDGAGLLDDPALAELDLRNAFNLLLLQSIDPQRDGVAHLLFLHRPDLPRTPQDLCEDRQGAAGVYRGVLLQQCGGVVHEESGPHVTPRGVARVGLVGAACSSEFRAEDLFVRGYQVFESVQHLLAVALRHDHQT
mmetsp:Transcript_28733/g.89352  ORF Transcript_28733/g.89352 Transcript_28733/m.89352 type:complete len:239 (-) Transcript_28733:3153-3869(-)